jgi:rod shape determining protein RodA
MIAVGSGQFVGRGLGFGSQSQLHFLPEAQTDFIISVIGEELGFVGVSVVLVLYGVLLGRLILIAVRCRNDFAAYTVLGVTLLFLVHVLVNIAGAIGLLPVTGVPLPFLSYGGSALVMNFLVIGVVESVARSIPAPQAFDEG